MVKRRRSIAKLTDVQLGFLLWHCLSDRYGPWTTESLLLREAMERLGYDSGPPEEWEEDDS